MAVNKGEIGIYGVLRRDGGNGVLANADLIYDVHLGTSLQNINKEARGIADNFDVYGTTIIIGSNAENIKLLPIGENYRPLLYLSTNNVYIQNPQGEDLLRSGEAGSDIYLGNSQQNITVVSQDVRFNVISFDNESSIIGNNGLYISCGTKYINNSITLDANNLKYISNADNVVLHYEVATNVLYLGNDQTPCELIINEDGINIRLSSSINNIKSSISVATRNIESLQERCYSVERSITNLVDDVNTKLTKKYDSTVFRTQNTVLAAPTTEDGVATFRKLEANDIPNLSSKYLILDSNGFLLKPSISGATIGYHGNIGFLKASIPSNVSGLVSDSWYYATDGSLLDGYSKFASILGHNLFRDPKNDGSAKICKLFNILCPTSLYTTGLFNILLMSRYSNCDLFIAINNDLGYDKTRIKVVNRNNKVNDRNLTIYWEKITTENQGDTYVFYAYNLNAYELILYDVIRKNYENFIFTPINKLVDSLPSNAVEVLDFYDNLNVKTATKLKTPVTIWGLSFDGSGNVSGNLSIGADKLTFGTFANYYQFVVGANGLLLGKYTNSDMVVFAPQGTYFGGVSAPTEKVEVNGNVKAKEYLLSDGSKYAESCLESDITALFN